MIELGYILASTEEIKRDLLDKLQWNPIPKAYTLDDIERDFSFLEEDDRVVKRFREEDAPEHLRKLKEYGATTLLLGPYEKGFEARKKGGSLRVLFKDGRLDIYIKEVVASAPERGITIEYDHENGDVRVSVGGVPRPRLSEAIKKELEEIGFKLLEGRLKRVKAMFRAEGAVNVAPSPHRSMDLYRGGGRFLVKFELKGNKVPEKILEAHGQLKHLIELFGDRYR